MAEVKSRRPKKKAQTRTRNVVTAKRDWQSIIMGIPGYDPHVQSDGYTFEIERAERALSFAETQLRVWEGYAAGQPFKLLPWQEPIAANLFGWVDKSGYRRYRESFIYVAKKNGKSPFCGFIMDYMLLCDGEAGAQVLCAACDTDQARIVFNNAWNLMSHNDGITEAVRSYISTREIRFDALNAKAKVLSSEFKAKDGINASCVLIDEVHRHDDRSLIDVLLASTSSRRQPLSIMVTTADYDRPSICNEKRKYAVGVRDNQINDPTFLPVIYEMGPDADWTDEREWIKANPALGVTKTLEYMRTACEKAKHDVGFQATFRRLECNQMTSSNKAWINLQEWDLCRREITDEMLSKCTNVLAVDLSSTTDVTSRAIVWCLPGDVLAVRVHCWIPEDKAQDRIKTDRVPYDAWRDAGYITFTPGNSVDYAYIRADINEITRRWKTKEVAMDPWNANQLMTQLQEEDGMKVIEFRQGFASMSPAAKEVERRIKAKTLIHDGNPVLRWMVGNTMVKVDPSGNIKPDKEKSSQRIDATVAMVMAVGRAVLETKKVSVYETRGVRTL
jgi:phage terminase large subunit-like protein